METDDDDNHQTDDNEPVSGSSRSGRGTRPRGRPPKTRGRGGTKAEKNVLRMQEKRQDPEFRAAERERNRLAQQREMEDPAKREAKRERDRDYQARRREGQARRRQTQETSARSVNAPVNVAVQQAAKKKAQKDGDSSDSSNDRYVAFEPDPEILEARRARRRENRRRSRSVNAEQEYRAATKEGPSHVCSCCACLDFSSSFSKYSAAELEHKYGREFLIKSCPPDLRLTGQAKDIQLCYSCKANLAKQKLPSLCAATCQMPEIPFSVARLNSIEERMVAAFLPLMQLRTLGAGGFGSSVINVPVDEDTFVERLPRTFDQTNIRQVKWGQQRGDESIETIHPARIRAALA